MDVLGAIMLPSNWNKMIRRNVYWMTLRAWDYRLAARGAIERASTNYGARLSGLGVDGCSRLRRDFLGMTEKSDLQWFLEWLGRPGHCDPEDYAELTRTPSVRARMEEFGLVRGEAPSEAKEEGPTTPNAAAKSPMTSEERLVAGWVRGMGLESVEWMPFGVGLYSKPGTNSSSSESPLSPVSEFTAEFKRSLDPPFPSLETLDPSS